MNEINLSDIVTNSDNSREPAPKLQGLGYGIVEPVEGSGKPSLFTLALGTQDDKYRYCKLIEEFEEGLADLAQSIGRQGQLQNCRVRLVGDNKYAVTFGARRALAVLYLHAKNGIPAFVMATVSKADDKAALFESAAENAHKLPPSLMDQARLFKWMRDQGMTVKEIATFYPIGKSSEQNIRHRLRLLELPIDMQLKVHHGMLSQDHALKFLKQREKTETGTGPNAVSRPGKGKAGVVGKLKRKEPDNRQEEGQVAEGDELQAALQDFVIRLTDIDLESHSPADPNELLRLTEEARRLLNFVEETASKGTLVHVG